MSLLVRLVGDSLDRMGFLSLAVRAGRLDNLTRLFVKVLRRRPDIIMIDH